MSDPNEDIAARLRTGCAPADQELCDEAADEIEKLRRVILLKTIAQLAKEAFEANERARALAQASVPTEYAKRKEQAVAYAEARAAAARAQAALDKTINDLSK